jgi:regulator of protease activity HflC (stomatin/prohibitin superfamily)
MEQVGGQFDDVVPPGLTCFNPCSQKVSGAQSLKVQLVRCDLNAVSKDRASVFVKCCIIFRAIPSQVHRSYYSMTGASDQIRSFVIANLRGLLPERTLDEIFMERDVIASTIRSSLAETLANYGFELCDVLLEDIDVRGDIRNSMNQQVFQRYNRVVQQHLGEIQKIHQIAAAEGEAEANRLRGVGTAQERSAIATAFQHGMDGFDRSGSIQFAELTALVLMTQYFDMVNDITQHGKVKPSSYYFPLKQGGGLDRGELRERLKRTLQQGKQQQSGAPSNNKSAAEAVRRLPIDASDL